MALPDALQQSLALLKQGPVQVMIDPDGTPVELFVKDGLDPEFMRGLEEAETDVVGVYDLFSGGDSAQFELRLQETSLNIVAVLFPDGLDGTTYRGFGKTAGSGMRTYAKKIRVRPWQTRTSAAVQIEFWKCVPSSDTGLSMTKVDPHTWSCTFRALPDPTKIDGLLVAKITAASRS